MNTFGPLVHKVCSVYSLIMWNGSVMTLTLKIKQGSLVIRKVERTDNFVEPAGTQCVKEMYKVVNNGKALKFRYSGKNTTSLFQ
jgi:hypothetical protein